MTARHTAGPWEVQRYVVGRDGREVGSWDRGDLKERLRIVEAEGSPMIIAEVVAGRRAEADLIAAAPALLEALKAINDCIAWSDTYQTWVLSGRERTRPALELVRSAIAAAKGGEE